MLASADLEQGLQAGTYEEVPYSCEEDEVAHVRLVSSSFVV